MAPGDANKGVAGRRPGTGPPIPGPSVSGPSVSGPSPSGPSIALRSVGPGDTLAIAGAVAGLVRAGDMLLLAGDLGAGKTAFAQGFGAGLGIQEPVTSPTFTLVRTYSVPSGSDGVGRSGGVRSFLHADVYRLDHLHEIVDLGLGQLVEDGAVALVEWGDLAAPVLGEGALLVQLVADAEDDQVRHIVVRSDDDRWGARWSGLSAALGRWGEDRT